MAKHDFGIMKTDPVEDKRYDEYEPEKYNCISIHDNHIEPLLNAFSQIECYWHTLARPEKGLAYWGITLIPPSSLDAFLIVLDKADNVEELKGLLNKAKQEGKFVIHFGI